MTKIDVRNLNTMRVREAYDGTKYVELGVKSCSCTYFGSHAGKFRQFVPCDKCATTGKVQRKVKEVYQGRKYTHMETIECKQCNGSGCAASKQWTMCERCNGFAIIPQNICDDLPQQYVDALEIRVYREGTYEHIAAGDHLDCYSCTDYGEHTRLTDEQLIAKVRESLKHVQATKLTQKDHTSYKFAHHIGVFCTQGGYTVRGVFDDSELVPVDQTPKYHKRRKLT